MMQSNGWIVDSNTVMYGVFGDPIAHSRSPVMLNRAFREMGINGVYAAFHVLPEQLRDAVDGIRALHFRGVNVTIPHKVEVMQYIDEIDEGAQFIGAVNTIVNEAGRLVGYNTDGIGYVRSLKEETGMSLQGKNILIMGAGGAARGVAYALAQEGPANMWIANRTEERAVQLAERLSQYCLCEGMGWEGIESIKSKVDLIVNTTSVGMDSEDARLPFDISWLHEGITASDIVYNKGMTPFLFQAQALGSIIHEGLGMFIYQGAYAFEYWTGMQAPIAAMKEVVEQSLGEGV